MRPKYTKVRARSENEGSGTVGWSLAVPVPVCFLMDEEDIPVLYCQSNLSQRLAASRLTVGDQLAEKSASERHSERKNSALDSLVGYIVWGRWEIKRKFRLIE